MYLYNESSPRSFLPSKSPPLPCPLVCGFFPDPGWEIISGSKSNFPVTTPLKKITIPTTIINCQYFLVRGAHGPGPFLICGEVMGVDHVRCRCSADSHSHKEFSSVMLCCVRRKSFCCPISSSFIFNILSAPSCTVFPEPWRGWQRADHYAIT